MLAHTLESVLVDVTNAGHGEAKGRATWAVKKEGGVGREGGACLVHEDIDGTSHLFFPLKVVGGTHQEVLPPTQERRGGNRSVGSASNIQQNSCLAGTIVPGCTATLMASLIMRRTWKGQYDPSEKKYVSWGSHGGPDHTQTTHIH